MVIFYVKLYEKICCCPIAVLWFQQQYKNPPFIFYHPFVNFKSNPIFAPVMVKLFHSETVCKGIRCNTWTVPAAVILFRTVRKAL